MIEIKEKDKWIYPESSDFYGFHTHFHDGRHAVEYYNRKIMERREEYTHVVDADEWNHPEAIDASTLVKEVGYHKIENFFDEEKKASLNAMRATINDFIDTNRHIKSRNQNMVFINHPLYYIPDLYKIAFDERIVNIAAGYFDCIPALSSIAVRKSFVTDGPAISNQQYHRDYNSLVKQIKFVVYLHDVNEDGGPFTYVDGSNAKMWQNWWYHHYPSDEMMENIYGKDKIVPITANFGDLLMANTRGMHKGMKPKKHERTAIHICYMIHPELGGPGHQQETPFANGSKMRKEDFDNLPDWKKPAADFLVKV